MRFRKMERRIILQLYRNRATVGGSMTMLRCSKSNQYLSNSETYKTTHCKRIREAVAAMLALGQTMVTLKTFRTRLLSFRLLLPERQRMNRSKTKECLPVVKENSS